MIGWEPIRENIAITNGDLIFSRIRDEGPIPAATVIEIIWDGGPTWPATTIVDATASWRIELSDLAPIYDGQAFTIWVRYPNGLTGTKDDYEWIKGSARRTPNEGF